MHKVLITSESKQLKDGFVVSFDQAASFIPALKDNHFEKVIVEARDTLNNTKFLLYIPRVLRNDVRLSSLRDNSKSVASPKRMWQESRN